MDITEVQRQKTNNNIRHPWEISRARVISFLLQQTVNEVRGHVLEIGAGDAFITRHLASVSTSNHHSAIDTAYTNQLVHTFSELASASPIHYFNSWEAFEKKQSPANIALLPDVLEHAEDDKELWNLTLQNTVTAPGAIILVTVPAFNILFSEHDRLLKHYRRYTRKQLVQICSSPNTTIISSGYFFIGPLIIRAVSMVVQKITRAPAKKSIDNWNAGKRITRFFTYCLWLDFKLGYIYSKFGITLPGLSCYCICRKSQ